MKPKYQYFDGIKFTLCEKSGYYRHQTLRKYMHRYVWEYYNGKIPSGYEVHHIDFDKSNNDISNLQLLTSQEHHQLHKELLTDQQREWRRNNMNTKARPKAIEWHKSQKGSEWHSEHIKQQHNNGKFNRQLICTNCGKEFDGILYKNGGNSFCSNACKSAYRRINDLDTIEQKCPICEKVFKTNKYRPSITCSRSCANKYRWQVKKQER